MSNDTSKPEVKLATSVKATQGDWTVTNESCADEIDIKRYGQYIMDADNKDDLIDLRDAINGFLEATK